MTGILDVVTGREPTRQEHLAWCKQRALEYVERGKLLDALTSMGSDLDKHPETRGDRGVLLGLQLWMAGNLQSRAEMQHFINGFN